MQHFGCIQDYPGMGRWFEHGYFLDHNDGMSHEVQCGDSRAGLELSIYLYDLSCSEETLTDDLGLKEV